MNEAIEYSFLKEEDLPKIHETFMSAFSDYQVDVSYMTKDVMYNRFVKNNVKYDMSVGAFNKGKLIGITMIGIDTFKDKLSAFDVMTGIVKDYRGLGIARKMFDVAVPKLIENNVEKFVLEVLRPNENAIKAYSKTGFNIVRELDCFEFFIKDFNSIKLKEIDISFKSVDKERINEFTSEIDWDPSWENRFSGIENIENEVISIGAFYRESLVGIIIYYPTLNWMMQLIVRKEFRRKGIATSLLGKLIEKLPTEKESFYFHNVESNQIGSKKFLKGVGFKEIIGQYEMDLILK